MSEASASDARVALVEAACVAITLCRGLAGAVRVPEVVPPVPRRTRQTEITRGVMGAVGSGGFERSVPLTDHHDEDLPQISPREDMRFSFAIALRKRCRAKLEGDMVGVNRGLETVRFGSPFCCRAGPAHTGSVGRDELAKES